MLCDQSRFLDTDACGVLTIACHQHARFPGKEYVPLSNQFESVPRFACLQAVPSQEQFACTNIHVNGSVFNLEEPSLCAFATYKLVDVHS